MKYKVDFKIDVAYPNSRISRKNGSVEVDAEGKMPIEEMKSDNELKMAIFNDMQPQIKAGKIFNVEITNILQHV